jgi:hypothetical protein
MRSIGNALAMLVIWGSITLAAYLTNEPKIAVAYIVAFLATACIYYNNKDN